MKLTIFSDCHGDLPILKDCDYVYIIGDLFPVINHSIDYQHQWFLNVFKPWLETFTYERIYILAGNHDFIFENDDLCEELSKDLNNVFIINQTTYISGLFKMGFSPFCKQFYNWAFMLNDEQLKKEYNMLPSDLDILFVHDAPDLNNQGVIVTGPYKNQNAGNKILAEIIKRIKPKIVIHGHIHEARSENIYNDIYMYNVSLKNDEYKIVNTPLNLNFDGNNFIKVD